MRYFIGSSSGTVLVWHSSDVKAIWFDQGFTVVDKKGDRFELLDLITVFAPHGFEEQSLRAMLQDGVDLNSLLLEE